MVGPGDPAQRGALEIGLDEPEKPAEAPRHRAVASAGEVGQRRRVEVVELDEDGCGVVEAASGRDVVDDIDGGQLSSGDAYRAGRRVVRLDRRRGDLTAVKNRRRVRPRSR